MSKGKFIDYIGKRNGLLTAIKRTGTSNNKAAVWLFKCDCGVEINTEARMVFSGRTTHCGCKHIAPNYKHGHCVGGPTRTHNIWRGIIDRCLNKNNSAWCHYGGRGISVCDR